MKPFLSLSPSQIFARLTSHQRERVADIEAARRAFWDARQDRNHDAMITAADYYIRGALDVITETDADTRVVMGLSHEFFHGA